MNRNVLIGVVVIALAAFGYWQFVYKPGQVAEATAAAEAAAKTAADEAAAAAKAAEEAAAATAAAATEAAAATTAAVTDTATAAIDTAMAAFDPANFNAAAWTTAVDGLTIPDAAKTAIKTAIDAAAADPAKVQAAIDAIRGALTTP